MSTPNRLPLFRITKVWAKNFRSIADASLALGQMTVLVGPNASGKSNVLDILRFVKDALRFDLEAAISIRHGFDALRRRSADDLSAEIEVGLSATITSNLNYTEGSRVDYVFTLAPEEGRGYRVSQEYASVYPADHGNCEPVVFKIQDGRLITPPLYSQYVGTPSNRWQEDDEATTFDTAELSLRRLARPWALGRSQEAAENDESFAALVRPVDLLLRRISTMRFYHIFPNTIRDPQRLGNADSLDEDASNLASVLRALEKAPGRPIDRIKYSLGLLVPGVSDLEVASVGGYLVVRVKHESVQGGGWNDLSQESDGTIRLLGLLAALHHRRALPLIGIEEPELTVHPGALTALADVLNESTRMSQVIVTTHSPDLIDRITDFRDVDPLRVVEMIDGATEVHMVSGSQKEAVMKHLFSPGELHRQGELERSGAAQ